MKILIITGGNSSERKISLISANSVKKALKENGHNIGLYDFKREYEELKNILPKWDAIFPVMHGKEGEDGTLYQFLRSRKKPFVGADPKGAKIAADKILFKKYCNKNHISTSTWSIIKNPNDISRFGFPCVLKAANRGSSHEVVIIHSEKDLWSAEIKKILQLKDSFFVEKLLTGTEITVGVILRNALPVLEIIPPENGWFDYKNKYSGATREIPFAPSVKTKIQRKAQAIALQIHRNLKLGSFSRTDFIVENDIPYVLEVNTPGGVGLTPQSLFPKAAKAMGISFNELVEKILEGRI